MQHSTFPKLRERITERFGTYAAFARHLELTPEAVTRRLSGHTDLSREEIETWCTALEIPLEAIDTYFYDPK